MNTSKPDYGDGSLGLALVQHGKVLNPEEVLATSRVPLTQWHTTVQHGTIETREGSLAL